MGSCFAFSVNWFPFNFSCEEWCLEDTDAHLIVRSDSSDGYYGGTLSAQRGEKEILLYTVSRAFADCATRYHITRKELISCLLILKEFAFDLIGREKVSLYTDSPFAYFCLKNPTRVLVEGNSLFARLLHDIRFVKFEVFKTTNQDSKWSLVDALSRSGSSYIIKARNILELLTPKDDPQPADLTAYISEYQNRECRIADEPIIAPILSIRNFDKLRTELMDNREFKSTGP